MGAGCGKPTKEGTMGSNGSGVEDVEGVLEEERDEGSDAARRETLSPEKFAKPLA